MSDPHENVRSTSVAHVHVAGSVRLTVPAARGVSAGALTAATLSLVQSAVTATPASVFQSFVVPGGVGVFLGVFIMGVLITRDTAHGSWDLADVLGKVGFLAALGAILSRVLPRWTSGGWWALLGGSLVVIGLVVLVDLLKAPSRADP